MFSSEPGNGTLPPAPLFLGVDLLHFRTPLLFYFPTSVCWDDQLHSKELTNLPLFLGILCIRLWGRCSRRQSWFAFQMVWFVQVIFCLYYWDGLFSLFFLDDLKLYELSSYCLIKFCRSKKKKNQLLCAETCPSLQCCFGLRLMPETLPPAIFLRGRERAVFLVRGFEFVFAFSCLFTEDPLRMQLSQHL